jgi:hypothetical protein
MALQATAELIRIRSEEGQLILSGEILKGLVEKGFLPREEDPSSSLDANLKRAQEEFRDLKAIRGRDGSTHYYSSLSMSDTYAEWVLRWGENPFHTMAEIIRENSKIYPRPVPLDLFQESPFGFSGEEIQDLLRRMAEQEDYRDIRQTQTSIGSLYLYSTLHLEPDYASTLAEWLDVGQANNP